jgi:hypothetical protein
MKQIFRIEFGCLMLKGGNSMKRMFRMEYGWLMLVVVFFFSGCSHFGNKANDVSSSEQAYAESQAPTASYTDFNDILIPFGLKVVSKETFVLRSSGLTAGVVVLKGRVDQSSLVNFFEINMIKDNWQLVSSFKLPRTLMLYHKDNKWCIINIFEGTFSTKVEIWVSPTQDGPNSGLLK